MNVAFIPVRGGSKSIPLKNIKTICGKPLVYWTLKAACECEYIDKVFVATDSDRIRETIENLKNGIESKVFLKAEVIERSAESATDTASTEFAMLEFANNYEFDSIVLIQATSPLLTAEDLNRGFEIYNEDGVDSVISAVLQKRFCWSKNSEGYVRPTNYDVFNRPRRQEFDGYLVENGAFYITSKTNLIKSRNRVSGNIKAVEMNENSYYEIDELSDWMIIETLMKKNHLCSKINIPKIKLFLTDCDGCLTDAGMYYSERGDELKKFNTRDGMGFKLLNETGILTGIVTSENVDLNRRRAEKLGLDFLEMGCKDKAEVVKSICEKNSIKLSNVCYIGDDINDIELIRIVGFGCAPADALPQVKEVADFVTNAKGGNGVIREIADIIINNADEE